MESVRLKIGDDDLILETGKIAKQANGAVFARYSGSAVLATVCCSDKEVEGLDYVPLQVEYNEKFYAAGKIPGGFIKREGRPKDKEILVSRLIDRPMRPLFHKEFSREIQVVPTTISSDQVHTPDIIAMVAASAAVLISDIPFDGPVSAVRVGMIDEEYIINPTFEEIERSKIDIIVSGTEAGITMVEGGASEVSEEQLLAAIQKAQPIIAELCKIQNTLRELVGKPKIELPAKKPLLEREDEIRNYAYGKLEEACFVKGKMERQDAIRAVKKETIEHFEESLTEDDKGLVSSLFEDMEYEIVRKSILEKGIRTDGRSTEDIRSISCEVGILPRTHGSALFTRGETQALVITTLGTVYDEQMRDDIDSETRYEHFMLHYNFPPFSVGETGRLFTGRREVGHGHLAQRAIEPVLPDKTTFPYTLRVVSEVLESNGSSSMATVCGSTLSLLNSGTPISAPVAGIAMGLITDENNTAILSDILGEEDHLGDMDFKVAGTEKGITAFQMDIKIKNVDYDIMSRALAQAKKGREYILDIMNKTLSIPNEQISEFAPKIVTMQVEEDKIGAIIGPGGKNIKHISETCNVNVNIDDHGKIIIYAKNREDAEKAEETIKGMVEEPEVGKIYNGVVKKIMDFGAFVEFLPGREGLVHISKLSRQRVNQVTDVLDVDQEIPVKLVEKDKLGRMNLSYIDAIDPDGSKDHGQGGRGREGKESSGGRRGNEGRRK